MSETLSIKEFAEVAGVSPQSIYKRVKKPNNPIHTYIEYEGEELRLQKIALKELYGVEVDQTTNKPSLKVEQPKTEDKGTQDNARKVNEEQEQTASFKVIQILREQIEAQRKDIENKNKQIEELNNRLAETTTLLDQQQKLSLADKKQLLLLEEKTKENKKGIIGKFINLFNREEATDNE